MATTPSTRNRSPKYLKIKEGKFIKLQMNNSASAGLLTELGIQEAAPADPTQIVGTGKEDALENGAVPVRVYYSRANGRTSAASVLCSPERADTIFRNAIGKNYAGRNIEKVRFPRRRVYVF